MSRLTSFEDLPNELLEKIFKVGNTLPMPVDGKYPQRPLFSKLPLPVLHASALSQVCVRWRHIAIRTPALWCTIHLSRTLHSHRRLKSHIGRSLDWVPIYIARSGQLPLHVTLDTTRLPPAEALHLVIPYSTRWRTFTLLVSHVGSLPSVLPLLITPRVPHLRTLDVVADIYREGIVCYEPLIPFFVTSTPQLASIHLKGLYVAWNELPLANLLNLELHLTSRWPSFGRLSEMFSASPRLMRLVIEDDIASLLRHVDQPVSRPRIELPALKHLEIHVHRVREEQADVVGLMGLFSTPSLETLTINNIKPEEWAAVTHRYHLPYDPRDFVPLSAVTSGMVLGRTDRSMYHGLTHSSFSFLETLSVSFRTSSGGMSNGSLSSSDVACY